MNYSGEKCLVSTDKKVWTIPNWVIWNNSVTRVNLDKCKLSSKFRKMGSIKGVCLLETLPFTLAPLHWVRDLTPFFSLSFFSSDYYKMMARSASKFGIPYHLSLYNFCENFQFVAGQVGSPGQVK